MTHITIITRAVVEWVLDICCTAKNFYWHWIIKGEYRD